MLDFDPSLWEGPGSVYFWGPDRTATAVAAFALARRVGPAIGWLNVAQPGEAPDEVESLVGALVPAARRFTTQSPSDLQPRTDAFDSIRWTLVRSDGPRSAIASLFDLVRLPVAALPLLTLLLPGDSTPTLVVTNADRIAQHYPDEIESTRRIIRVLAASGAKLVLSYNGLPRSDRFAFDHVIRIDRVPGRDWRTGMVVVEPVSEGRPTIPSAPVRLEMLESVRGLLGLSSPPSVDVVPVGPSPDRPAP